MDYDTETKVTALLNWANASAPASFDPSFVESVQEFISKNGEATSKQDMAINNIIESFRIDVDAYL